MHVGKTNSTSYLLIYDCDQMNVFGGKLIM